MKYISLIRVMSLYIDYIKDYRSMLAVGNDTVHRTFDEHTNYRPFTSIVTASSGDAGQVTKTLALDTSVVTMSRYRQPLPEQFALPPVVEMEWFRAHLQFEEGQFEALEQISYLFIMEILCWGYRFGNQITPADIINAAEETGIIIEMEDIDDMPAILSQIELPVSSLPKYRTWAYIYLYGNDFLSLFARCKDMSSSFSMYYMHMPVMLAMFVVECYGTDLKNWSKNERLTMENMFQEISQGFGIYNMSNADIYTYGTSSGITHKDEVFICDVFRFIYEKIHRKNANIGLITYRDYTYVRGPETVRASVRLTGMEINWREEMKRVEKESENDENEFDGD